MAHSLLRVRQAGEPPQPLQLAITLQRVIAEIHRRQRLQSVEWLAVHRHEPIPRKQHLLYRDQSVEQMAIADVAQPVVAQIEPYEPPLVLERVRHELSDGVVPQENLPQAPQLVEAVRVEAGYDVVLEAHAEKFEHRAEDVARNARQAIVVQVQVVEVTQSLEHFTFDRLEEVRREREGL